MTDRELDALTVLYRLEAAIEDQDWPTARVVHAHLLQMLSPGAERPHVDVGPLSDEALIQMAERRQTMMQALACGRHRDADAGVLCAARGRGGAGT